MKNDPTEVIEFAGIAISAGRTGNYISIGTLNFDFDKMTMKENAIRFHKNQANTVITAINNLVAKYE